MFQCGGAQPRQNAGWHHSANAAPRVILVPLRARGSRSGSDSESPSPAQQEPLVLELEQPSKKAARPLQRSSYRRKSADEDAVQAAKREARQRQAAQDAAVRQFTEDMRGGKHDAVARGYKPSVLLVDGYNILHREPAWLALFRQSPDFARAEMEKWIDVYAREAGIRCLVVYDAMMSRGKQDIYTRVTDRVTRVFVVHCEADTLIVSKATQLKRQGAYKVVVVSGDSRIHTELADEQQSFVMLDASSFTQHLRECRAGKLSAPQLWRSSWQIPTLSPSDPSHTSLFQRLREQHALPGHPNSNGSESDCASGDEDAWSESEEESGRLEEDLCSIVEGARRRRRLAQLMSAPALDPWQAAVSPQHAMQVPDAELRSRQHGLPGSAIAGAVTDRSRMHVPQAGHAIASQAGTVVAEDDDDVDLDALLNKKL